MLQTSWTAICGAVAFFEGLVLAWWAEKLHHVWSRLYYFVMTIQWPWHVRTEVEADNDNVDAADATSVVPKRVGRRQPAIDARDTLL